MEVTYQPAAADGETLDCLVLFFTEERLEPPGEAGSALRDELQRALALGEFKGKAGQQQIVPTRMDHIPRLLLIGVGKTAKAEREQVRRAAGTAGKQLATMNLSHAGVWVPHTLDAARSANLGQVLAEGLLLGAYKFEPYKSKEEEEKDDKRRELERLTVFDPAGLTSQAMTGQGVVRGDAVCRARNLGNHPANVMTPTRLAEEAHAVAERHGLTCRVLERDDLERLGMGLFLGVTQGSRQPPKLIVLEYRPSSAQGSLMLVGKGITFDSGGISIKPAAAMDEMKFDMCGAAAVIGAMDAVGALKPAVNVTGLVPACENLPDGQAVKPGDILAAYSGKHVEILNTDAEGRLILSDALAYGIEQYKPDAVVDLATLTGACVIALGHYATGAVSNDDALLDKVVAAGKASGDVVWPLPNFAEYEELLKGKYADLQNVGPREGGAITAGLFLKQFVGEVPWVHLDIAGTAWGVKNIGHVPNEGATGVGVALLVDLVAQWSGTV